MSTRQAGDGATSGADELPEPGEFFAQLDTLDQVSAHRQFRELLPALARAGDGTRGEWHDAVPSSFMSKATFDGHMKDAVTAAREADRAANTTRGGPRPDHDVNVSSRNPYRYSLEGEFGRAMFEQVRDDGPGVWRRRLALPFVHARVVRRDGTRRRVDTEYLMSAELDGPRVLVGEDELTEGRWARKLGVNLSSDRDIIAAAGTAIRDVAHRWAPEREAVARLDAHTASGHLDVPVPECLPSGYLTMPLGVTPAQARETFRELAAILAERPKMALVLGASVGAPFVGPLRRQSHWVDLYGDSQKGKTTTQAVAASVWGDPTIGAGIVAGWDATSIGVGRLLGQLSILPPFFDERKVAPYPREKWGEVIYQTCQGSSRLKAEANTAQGTHKAAPWFGVLFSTGNHRLTDGIAAGGYAGIPARVLELAAPFTDDQAEAERVAGLLRGCYGWLGAEVMRTFTVPMVAERIAQAEEMVGTPECGGIPGTIAKHLHSAVAGAMMADEILGTGSALTSAALVAACEYLEVNGHTPTHDADRMVDALAESVTAHRSAWPTHAEYVELENPRPEQTSGGYAEPPRATLLAQRGYDRQPEGIRSDDGLWLYVFPATWARVVGELGADSSVAAAELFARGHLHVSDGSRKRGEWHSIPRVLGKATRVYQVAMVALEGDQDPDNQGPPTGPDPAPAEVADELPGADAAEAASSPDTAAGPRWRASGEPVVGAPEAAELELSEPEPEPVDQAEPEPVDQAEPAAEASRATTGAPGSSLAHARVALAEGRAPRFMAALEGEFAPLRGRGKREPYFQPPVPAAAFASEVITSWGWERAYSGEVVVLDRTASYVAAASSVLVAHGKLEHTGECEFDNRPGYYKVQVHPWHESGSLPHPLGQAGSGQAEVWVPAPMVALLVDLAAAGRWADVTVLDSYTSHGVRIDKWATFVATLRTEVIAEYGRDSSQYAEVKRSYGQAFSMMLGYLDGRERKWKCKLHRPDWSHAIFAQAAVTLWRRSDDCLAVAPDLGPVALRNVDELVIPRAALEIVTTVARPGGRPPVVIDQDGNKLGTFGVKSAESWKAGA